MSVAHHDDCDDFIVNALLYRKCFVLANESASHILLGNGNGSMASTPRQTANNPRASQTRLTPTSRGTPVLSLTDLSTPVCAPLRV